MTNDHEQFDTIEEIVNYLEKEYDITVLSIRDYGSRAWNLDSESGDMDAGMVFTQPQLSYVQLGQYQQNIDRKFMLDGEEFELVGWNIKRFAELLNKSNPSMIEWLNSDITYFERVETPDTKHALDHVLEDVTQHANQEFKPISLFYHYRSMGKSNYSKYIESRNDLSIKRHLYILTGLTYARYVEKTHSMPPLDYTEFYKKHLPEMGEIPVFVKKYIGEFIHHKKNGDGDKTVADHELWEWMRNELDHKLDNEEHDVRGIKREKINNLIQNVTQ